LVSNQLSTGQDKAEIANALFYLDLSRVKTIAQINPMQETFDEVDKFWLN